ncbi:MAG: GNAT family N-acetyltransferase [Oscillospiraceae bacterium]
MILVNMSIHDIKDAVKLWNDCVDKKEFCYKPMTEESFQEKFFDTLHYSEEYVIAAKNEEELIGFAISYKKREYLKNEDFYNTPAYLTMVIVKPEERRKGIGTKLVKEIEKRFQTIGKQAIRVTYRNPVTLSWVVPNTVDHDHNNAPGVDKDSVGFAFLNQLQYVEQQTELGMHMDLGTFVPFPKYQEKIDAQAKMDIEVTLYNSKLHHGFDELFDNLHGEVWRKSIADNLKLEQPLPVIVASHNGKIVGFAGPIDVESSGRGWFNGIATHSEYERKGLAFVMFSRLMLEFQRIGARFSTLFTDEGNPAGGLYEAVGFCIAKKWAVVEKELNADD